MARKSTGKRQRFEIFKRDCFACQYCGRTPPAVILEVDHITPVSKGGGNDSLNLITACFDCNRGKSDRTLDQVLPTVEALIEEQKARRRQVLEYNKFLTKARKDQDKEIDELGVYWHNNFREKDTYTFGPSRRPSIRKFLEYIPKQHIQDAIDTAFARVSPHGEDDTSTFKYFCGICWKRIKA